MFIVNSQLLKSMMPSFIHLPWLTSVQHVQPLQCVPVDSQPDWPRPIQSVRNSTDDTLHLTIVIVTARPEFKRLPVTLAALVCHLNEQYLTELMFLVPPDDVAILDAFLSKTYAHLWPWPIVVQSDDSLLKHRHTHSYRLQMMFKLLLAQIISTEYYLILDSDCVAVWPIHIEQLLYRAIDVNEQDKHEKQRSYRAIYQIEGKLAHEQWWLESEQLIQISLEQCTSKDPASSPTMGVTPSILSRTIALRTLCRLQKLYGRSILRTFEIQFCLVTMD
jgi:hypothetical protein